MNINRFDPSIELDEIKAMLDGKDDLWQLFLRTIEKHNECTYIARNENNAAGFLSLNRNDSRMVKMTVYVDELFRRKGIGTELLRFSDLFISESAYEHADCIFPADRGMAEFLSQNGYSSYCLAFDMERDNTLIDSDKLSDESLLKAGIIIKQYNDDDYMSWHNISDVAFYLLRKKLGLTPSYYQPPSASERKKHAADNFENKYIMFINDTAAAISRITDNEISLLAVRPDLQLHGYGWMTVSYLINKLIMERHAEKVKISVLDGNPAKMLYESLGFRDVRLTYEYKKYYRPESRPKAPEGYANEAEILNELRLHGMLREEIVL
jgi:GNAT superfamily N-acetyltransferase